MRLTMMAIMATFMFLFLAATPKAQPRVVFDMTNARYGGIKSNYDITDSLAQAWSDACASIWPSRLVVPHGTYWLRGSTFKGPCKASVEVQLRGTLKAPKDGNQLVNSGYWVAFQHIDRLFLSGGGTFDGQGAPGWNSYRAINVRFDYVTNSVIQDIISLDSKNFHINVYGCHDVTFQRLTITAAAESDNTDGVHIGHSWRINVTDTNIGTGDDCVSIGDDTSQIIVSNVNCGPGHGISIGSLGKYLDEKPVYDIVVKNCTLTNTTNGVRIKTWPGSPIGFASHIYFEDIIMNDVKNPIIIDQNYCPGHSCKQQAQSNVKISNVSFKDIRGTSASQDAVTLACSGSWPCENVELIGVDLVYSGDRHDQAVSSRYSNVVNPTIINVKEALACRYYRNVWMRRQNKPH